MADVYDDDPDDFQRGLYGPDMVDWQPSGLMKCGHPIDWLDDDNGCRGCASGRTFCEPCALLLSCPEHDPQQGGPVTGSSSSPEEPE